MSSEAGCTEVTSKDILHLSDYEVEDVLSALRYFQRLVVHLASANTFPLSSNLATRLNNSSHIIHSGRDFFLLRGLNAEMFSAEENTILFLGILSHIASARGVRMDHICDLSNIGVENSLQVEELMPPHLSVEMVRLRS